MLLQHVFKSLSVDGCTKLTLVGWCSNEQLLDRSKLSREDSQWTEAKKSLLTNHVFDLVCFHVDTLFLWFNWDVQRRIILLISPASFATSWQYASVAGWTVPKSPSSAEICDKKLPNLRLCEWVEVVQLSAGSKQKIGIPILVFLCDHVAQNVNPVTLAVPHVVLICHCMLESWIVSLAVGQNVKKSVQTKN